jgi:hypothetical protein
VPIPQQNHLPYRAYWKAVVTVPAGEQQLGQITLRIIRSVPHGGELLQDVRELRCQNRDKFPDPEHNQEPDGVAR